MLQLATVFMTVFLAELGDKTQLATLFFAAGRQHHPFVIFLAAAGALTLSTALAVLLGTYAARHLQELPIKPIAGFGFIAIGVWTLIEHFRAA